MKITKKSLTPMYALSLLTLLSACALPSPTSADEPAVTDPAPLPEVARGKAENDVIDIQEDEFRLYKVKVLVNLVDDPKASNKRAAQMVGNSGDWIVQYQLGKSAEFLKNDPWHCYVVARVKAKAGAQHDGPAIFFGLYDEKNKLIPGRSSKTIEEVGDDEYRVIDMGSYELHPEIFLYAAPPNWEGIESVSIDRFIMVREPRTAE